MHAKNTSIDKTDEELVALASAGDTTAFNQLVGRWERTILGLAYRVLGREEDARDICQEAFLRAYRGLGNFKGQAKFSSWLYRIALNLCRDWLRRQRRRGEGQPPEGMELTETTLVDPISDSVEDVLVRRDLGRAVGKIMATLPDEQRTVIVLKEYHGLTFREIADLLDCPQSTVKTRLYQGLNVLRQRIARRGLDLTPAARSPVSSHSHRGRRLTRDARRSSER